ncbi:MAG: divergent polysaccharide deacetylase family protein [Alphaproteobacteria bacterium]|nr:divergent polysaccharide deacetylase family protein [Alphaproteobacteria bacterium]
MAVNETIEHRDETPQPRRRRWRWRLWALLALALLLAFGVWQERARRPSEAVAIIPPAAVPLPAKTAAPENLPAWIRYAVPAPPDDGRPRVVVIIDGLGIDSTKTARAIALPPAVTLSFVVYAADLAGQAAAAHRAGHELLLRVPMEPVSVNAAMGAYGLGRYMPRDELLRRLRWDLARFDGYVGIDNHMGTAFAADAPAMRVVMGELKQRGLLYLDARAAPTEPVAVAAQDLGVPYASRDIFLDGEEAAISVDARLAQLVAIARKRGSAIAVGHPHATTLAALARWLPTLRRQGIVLVPLTAVIRPRAAG